MLDHSSWRPMSPATTRHIAAPFKVNVPLWVGSPKARNLVLVNIAVSRNTIIGEIQTIEATSDTGPRLVAFSCKIDPMGPKIKRFKNIKLRVGVCLILASISTTIEGRKNDRSMVAIPQQRKI